MSRIPAVLIGSFVALTWAVDARGQSQPQPVNATARQPQSRAGQTPPESSQPAQSQTPQAQTAQSKPAPPPTTDPADNQPPADLGEQLSAKVIEVEGGVEFASGAADPFDVAAWKPVELNMLLPPDSQIRTGMRSRCTLQFGEEPDITVVQLRRATLAKISDYRRSGDTQRVRIGLGYGAVRGGSSEGTLRSDVVVDSSVATLAKRGTEGWEIEIEPVSGTFRISLSRSGLVEAYSKAEKRSQEVAPGEYVSNETIARLWINQEIFDRAVAFYEPFSLTEYEVELMLGENSGYSSLGPNGSQLYGNAGRRSAGFGASAYYIPPVRTFVFQRLPVRRAEGNFGFSPTFRVLTAR